MNIKCSQELLDVLYFLKTCSPKKKYFNMYSFPNTNPVFYLFIIFFFLPPGPDSCDGSLTSSLHCEPRPHEIPVKCGRTEHTQEEALHVLVQTEGQAGGWDTGTVCRPQHHLPGELFPADARTSHGAQGEEWLEAFVG